MKKITSLLLTLFFLIFSLTTKASAQVSDYTQFKVDATVKIVGLGEASHGVHEYQVSKLEIFKALVANNQTRTFVLEADFGSGLKVNDFIHGGSGTAEEMAESLGFTIYQTEEITGLIQWMRDYNSTAQSEDQLNFYGMDLQAFDHSKSYALACIEATNPDLAKTYQEKLKTLTDAARLDLKKDQLEPAQKDLEGLSTDLAKVLNAEKDPAQQIKLNLAIHCVENMTKFCQLLLASDRDYNVLRDQAMFDNVKWLSDQNQAGPLLISGHNGHIRRIKTFYPNLGESLSQSYQDQYFSLGTDAAITHFHSKTNDGFEEITANNSNAMTDQLKDSQSPYAIITFDDVADQVPWQKILGKKQTMTSFNVSVNKAMMFLKQTYTESMIPQEAYDGMIIYKEVQPSRLLK